jgi:deoxyribose-phosphate aldolase
MPYFREVNIAQHIEHTALHPTLTQVDVDTLVSDAIANSIFGVCVPPFWVKRAKREIGNSSVQLVTVAGFPLGYSITETKLDEIKRAIDNGADEVDIVWNITSFKSHNPWTKIDVAKCAKLVHDHQKLIKVIIETAYLSHDEIIEACKICTDAGTDFLKTSTGFASEGAKVEHIALMRNNLPTTVGIKASGGIKTFQHAKNLIQAGADRIGTSSGVKIVLESNNQTNP